MHIPGIGIPVYTVILEIIGLNRFYIIRLDQLQPLQKYVRFPADKLRILPSSQQ